MSTATSEALLTAHVHWQVALEGNGEVEEADEEEEERDDTLARFEEWWPEEDIVQITLDEDSLEVVDSSHGVKRPEGPLRSYKELEEADELDLFETEALEDDDSDKNAEENDNDDDGMACHITCTPQSVPCAHCIPLSVVFRFFVAVLVQ